MARPLMFVWSMGAALIMLGCSPKNNTSIVPGADSGAARPEQSISGATTAVVPLSIQPPLVAAGANPDWSIRIDPGSVTVKGFDGSIMLFPATKAQVTGTSAQFTMGGGANLATLTLRSRLCVETPGSSMTAEVLINGRTGTGCAVHPDAKGATDASADWSSTLFDFVPAMRACLARGEADRAYANRVERRADGAIAVRLRYADSTEFSCTTGAVGQPISQFEAVAESADEDIKTPAFALTPTAFASMGCDDAPTEVIDSGGAVLGYLQRGLCTSGRIAPIS